MYSTSGSSAQNSLEWNVIYFKENIRGGTSLGQQLRRFWKVTVAWNYHIVLSHPNGSGI